MMRGDRVEIDEAAPPQLEERPPDQSPDKARTRILLVGEDTGPIAGALAPVAVSLKRVRGLEAARVAVGPHMAAAVLVAPLAKSSLPRAVALLRSESGPDWPILAVVPDGISDAHSRRLYRQGATAVFEWPGESQLFPRMTLEVLGAERRRSPATEADRALEKALRIRLNLIPGDNNGSRVVRVRVREGAATITGEVEALWAKDRIERSAAAMPGVASVATGDLDVAASGLTDGEIAANVRAVLRGATSVEERTLTAFVNDGHVILKGTVLSLDELERLRELVANANGVRSITDRTERAPRKKRRNRDVARRLQEFVDQLFPEESVRVTVLGEVAVLTGQVARLDTKQLIRAHISRDDSIVRVVSKIEVVH